MSQAQTGASLQTLLCPSYKQIYFAEITFFFQKRAQRSGAWRELPAGASLFFSFISAYFHKSNTNIGYYYNRSREDAHTDRLLPFIAFIKSLRSFTPVTAGSGPFAAGKSILRNILTPIFRRSPNNPIS